MIRKALKALTLGAMLAATAMTSSSYADVALNPKEFSTDCDCSVLGFDDGKTLHIFMYEAGIQQISDDPIDFAPTYANLDQGPSTALVEGTMAIRTTNFNFASPQNMVLLVNAKVAGTDYTLVFKPSAAASNSLDFKLEPRYVIGYIDADKKTIKTDLDVTAIDEISAFVGLRQTDAGTTQILPLMDVAMVTLKPGLKGNINITLVDKDGNHVYNGCVKADIYAVMNEYVARSAGVDNEPLAVAEVGGKWGIVKLYDEGREGEPVNIVLYKRICDELYACQHPITATEQCPNPPSGDCSLFCNAPTPTAQPLPTAPNVSCINPDACDDNSSCENGDRLAIFESIESEGACYKVVTKVESLAQTTVKLTLSGESFNGVKRVTFKAPIYDDVGKIVGYDKLCDARIEDGEASCPVSGEYLFVQKHKNPRTGSVDVTFEIEVDGKTPLSPRDFYASAELSGGFVKYPAVLDWGKVMTWGKADQSFRSVAIFKAPYVRSDSSVTTGIRLENSGSSQLTIALYVSDPAGGWKYVDVVNLNPGEEKVLSGAQIETLAKEKAGLDLATVKNGRFAILGIANMSPCTQNTALGSFCAFKDLNIYVSQQDVGTGSFRYIPVEVLYEVPENLHF